ncbi:MULTISPECIES: zeta toxin family protein [unclassified Streptomyces]|uniref:zeta toxin family protein n=1 Tax=unclassified Streptomyces TaxID=2593676 RepID=UPI00068F0DB3|nr:MULTISPECIES: zeta toxin family protein [unclassified Streptomyces]MCH0560406.1 zeta toxin family protein [Streptomyces sp. MUM 16J]
MTEYVASSALDGREHRDVLHRLILPQAAGRAVRQDRPVVVVVGGPPGAGKTVVGDLVQAALRRRGGSVRIGRDLYKAAHRHYAAALAVDVRTAGAKVRADTSSWQAAVEEYVRDHGLDAVVESALADPDDFRASSAAYAAARDEAEHHGVTGERGNSQAHRAFALAFTDPAAADNELALAEQLLADVDLRATTLITRVAALARDAGRTDADIDDRAQVLRAEIRTAGVTYTELALDLALAFHHAVRNDPDQVAATIARLHENTRGGSDITAFMAGLPLEEASPTRWIDSAQHARRRWRDLVTARRDNLHTSP